MSNDNGAHNAKVLGMYMVNIMQQSLPKGHFVKDSKALMAEVEALSPEKVTAENVSAILQKHTEKQWEFGKLPPASQIFGGGEQ